MNPLISSDLDLTPAEPEPELDEKHDVATISTDEVMDVREEKPLATDQEAIKKKFFEADPDLEIVDEAVHVFNITNWKDLEEKVHGPVFTCGEVPWRVLMFPFGNNNNGDFASFYLEHSFEDKPPEGWYCCAQFLLCLSNPNDPSVYQTNSAHHRFHADAADWGFTRFADLRKLFHGPWDDQGKPLIEDGAATMTVYVRVVKDPTGVLWHDFYNYDSKKETGMVGIKNQGATCYLNSLLQSLYFTNSFRKAIYQIPTEGETKPKGNSAYALQRLFYLLQTSDTAVGTNELTSSFGWESKQIFEQQDVQECSRLLMDRMEERMKGTEAEKALPNLFVGSTKTYIQCINVDYESSGHQVFWDIQLNVRGNANLDESFKDDIQVETLEGDNKYFAEGFGLQDAKKGSIFEKFPPVLHIQLKRFEYNFQLDSMTKIYDRHEFPEVFDASPYLSKDADRSEPYIYHLHGVLVHSGDLNAGHYYAFLKPQKNGHFYRFDDDRVTRATKKEALDENFGGDFANQPNGVTGQRNPYTWKWSKQRFMSAYMLVYIRESRLDEVLQDIRDDDVPSHLEKKIKEEQADFERRKKEREEAPLYMNVIVGDVTNFNAHQGFDIFAPVNSVNADPAALPKVHRVLKTMKIDDFVKMMSKEMDIDEDMLRPWACVSRQNHTIRPDQPVDWPDKTLEEAAAKIQSKMPFRIWMEVAEKRNPEGQPDRIDSEAIVNLKSPTKPIILFLKYFDVENQTLKGRGYVYIEKHKKVSDLGPIILERMGWPAGTNMKLYEEIRSGMIEPLKTSATFATAELQDGDIICFQKIVPESEANAILQAGNCTDAPKFYDYLVNRVRINFYDRNDIENVDRQFHLELSKRMTYDQIAAKVGEHLKVDPTHLRFSTVISANGKPRPPIRRTLNQTLASMMNPQIGGYGPTSTIRNDVLLYEILELSLSELELKKALKITLLSEGITKEEIFDVLVPKNGIVRDFIQPLKKKANLTDEQERNLRFYEVRAGKIYHELDEDYTVGGFSEYGPIYAEQIPQEEIDADPAVDRAVYCFHFDKEPHKVHSVPFKFIVKPGEVFKDTKERLSARTGIKGKQFEKIKFAVVGRANFAKPEYLEDDDVLADKLTTSEDQLGLDHLNKSRNILNRGDVMMIR